VELGTAILLAVWGALVASVILRLRRRGAETFDGNFEPRDRKLVGALAFYLLVPLGVLLSQLVQVALLQMSGAGVGPFSTWVFWGIVEPAHPEAISAYERAAMAMAGPVTLLGFVAVAIAWTKARPTTAAKNFLRLEFARLTMSLALGVHAIAAIVIERGDYWTLRTSLNEVAAPAGDLALLLGGLVAAFAFWAWRSARKLRFLATHTHDVTRRARARLAEWPDDPSALRELGAAQLTAGAPGAIATLERALRAQPDNPRTELMLGQAMLTRGEARAATLHLRNAGLLLEEAAAPDEPLLFEVTLALSAARMMLGDAEGAIATAAAARKTRPADLRGLLLFADTLVAGGQRDAARDQLVAGLEGSEGAARHQIQRRLAALKRR